MPVIHSIFSGVALIDTLICEYAINYVRGCKLYIAFVMIRIW